MVWGKNSTRLNKLKYSLENNEIIEAVTNMFLNNNTDEMLAKQIKYVIKNYSNGTIHLGSIDEISHSQFIKCIVNKLGYKNVKINEIKYGEDKCICMLGTNNILPIELQISNNEIINNLIK